MSVWVRGASALGAFGTEWRGLFAAAAGGISVGDGEGADLGAGAGAGLASRSIPLAALAGASPVDARQRKMMSHAAWLACIALRKALCDAAWSEGRAETGCYFGVGASGSSMPEVTSMVQASLEEGRFAMGRFGTDGLAACNPLFAFQLMNNFTLCHGAILEGLGGPNAAFYSRGVGTVAALSEAAHAIREGLCERAVAGAADTALHPVTIAELRRNGFLQQGLEPAEAAAALALTREREGAMAKLELSRYFGGGRRDADVFPREALSRGCAEAGEPDLLVLAPWGDPAREALLSSLPDRWLQRPREDVGRKLGESLAASPAIAWVYALGALVSGKAGRLAVLSAGIDGGAGLITLSREGVA